MFVVVMSVWSVLTVRPGSSVSVMKLVGEVSVSMCVVLGVQLNFQGTGAACTDPANRTAAAANEASGKCFMRVESFLFGRIECHEIRLKCAERPRRPAQSYWPDHERACLL